MQKPSADAIAIAAATLAAEFQQQLSQLGNRPAPTYEKFAQSWREFVALLSKD